MKNTLLILFLFCFNQAFSQKKITELNFPYHKGYELKYNGEMKTLTTANEYITKPQGLVYKIPDERTVKNENWVVFSMGESVGDTTTVVQNTYLTQDKRGMSWWTADSATKMFDKQRTWALKLPLKAGKKWKTYYSDHKTTFTCITTDTIIETELGKLTAFGTVAQFTDTKTKDYQIVVYFYEYYNQDIGKIMTREKAVLELLKSGKKILISEGYMKVYSSSRVAKE